MRKFPFDQMRGESWIERKLRDSKSAVRKSGCVEILAPSACLSD